MGEEDGFEEWDADFINQLIHVEERALSSAFSQPPPPTQWTHSHSQNPPPPPPLSFSPPRELSQRPPPDSDARADLGWPGPHSPTQAPRVSLQQKDGGENRNKRGRRRELHHQPPAKSVCPPYPDRGKVTLGGPEGNKSVRTAAATNAPLLVPVSREREVEAPSSVSMGVATTELTSDQIRFRANIEATFRAVGVQTDEVTECTGLPSVDKFRAHQKLSNNLMSIWCLPTNRQLPSTFLSKLFVACRPLFCTMNANKSFKSGTDCFSDKFSADASEVAMVSKFYSAFIEVSNGMGQLETLFQPLFDLCSVDNVAVLSGSLNIMYLILDHLLTSEPVSRERKNVVWNWLPSTNDTSADQCGNKEFGFDPSVSCSKGAPTVFASEDYMLTKAKSQLGMGDSKCAASENLISIFGLMHELIKRNSEECVRLGAASVMKAVLLRGSAYEDRMMFPLPQVFESVSILLKKDSGKKLQEEALHLLFLLLNCPKAFEAFVVNCEDTSNLSVECQVRDTKFPGIDIIESLADCVSYSGDTVQDLIIKRKAVVLVAFIASSGSKGFEVVINSRLPNERNVLVVMLQALVSDLDIEAGGSTKSPEIWRERNLLMREALILLNRLISNLSSSSACLRLLTNSRYVAGLTISFASRMCKRQPRCIHPDGDSLIGVHDLNDLSRAFKRRVFAYFGDHIT